MTHEEWTPTSVKPFPVEGTPDPTTYALLGDYYVTLKFPNGEIVVVMTSVISHATPEGRVWAWNLPQVINGRWEVTAWMPAVKPEPYRGES